jgi:hypothetical protein
MEKRAFGTVALVLGSAWALAWSSPAGAQEFLRDTRVANGAGIEAGGFEIHPGLAAEVGWDSNYLGRSDKTGANIENGAPLNGPIDTGMLRVTPSLSLSMAPHSSTGAGGPFALALGASGTYREFFNPLLSNQRNMSVNANAGLVILPGHEWSGSISGNFSRTIQPTILGNPDLSYNNDLLVGVADLAAQPNLGTLDWHFGYIIAATIFEQSAGNPYNNLLNTGYTRGKWNFRPRTALIYDGQISYRDFSDTTGAAFALHQSTPVRARVGLQGLVTPAFSILGMIGYGATLENANFAGDTTVQQYDSIIGALELKFFPGGSPPPSRGEGPVVKPSLLVSTIAVGYNRDFMASYMGDFYGLDRGYLKAEYFFGGTFLVTLTGGVGALEHPSLYYGSATGAAPSGILMANSYTDVAADATLYVQYNVLQSLAINATGMYSETLSNTQLPVAPNSPQVYDLNIRHISAFLGVRWFL